MSHTTSPPQQASVFDNLLLSPRAFKHQGLSPTQIAVVSPQIPICRTCLGSLKREKPKPPKLSIANGFYIGELPESLRTASRVDIKICSSAYNGGNIGYVKHFDKTTGGMEHGNRRLKGHTYCTKMDVGQIAMHLPLHPSKQRLDSWLLSVSPNCEGTPVPELLKPKNPVCTRG